MNSQISLGGFCENPKASQADSLIKGPARAVVKLLIVTIRDALMHTLDGAACAVRFASVKESLREFSCFQEVFTATLNKLYN